jgi:16S rRNA (adenine1518-N6/adenine1519-N6)-dimethyltransferase
MVQREVAERIAAAPGAMSYLSVFVQYHADVRVARVVPASSFEPAPAVQSAVLVGEVRPRRLSPDDEERLWRLAQAGFRERRKMLHNVLPRQLPQIGGDRLRAALDATGIDGNRRSQTLSVEDWMRLAEAIGSFA